MPVRSALAKAASEACNSLSKTQDIRIGSVVKAVEDVQVGDRVWAWDEARRRLVCRRITRLFRHPDQPVLELTCATAQGSVQTISGTTEHPFWVKNKGWTAFDRLAVGDFLSGIQGGELMVVAVQRAKRSADVFNFEVDGAHSYYVGRCGLLVHNMSRNPVNRETREAVREVLRALSGAKDSKGRPRVFDYSQVLPERPYAIDRMHTSNNVNSGNITFNNALRYNNYFSAALKGKTFEQVFRERKMSGQRVHLLDLGGSGAFIDPKHLCDVDTLTGVRRLEGRTPLPPGFPNRKWSEIHANLYTNGAWKTIRENMASRGIDSFTMITIRPAGPYWTQSSAHLGPEATTYQKQAYRALNKRLIDNALGLLSGSGGTMLAEVAPPFIEDPFFRGWVKSLQAPGIEASIVFPRGEGEYSKLPLPTLNVVKRD